MNKHPSWINDLLTGHRKAAIKLETSNYELFIN